VPKLSIPLGDVDHDLLSQLEYAMTFVSEDITSYVIDEKNKTIEAEISGESSRESVVRKISELIERYSKREFGMLEGIHFDQRRDLPPIDAWSGMLERRWVTSIGAGHVVLRGPAALLQDLIDAKVRKVFAAFFKAELELYPSTIMCSTLDRCNHFTSFPEHIDFVSHLKQDLDVLNAFSAECREKGWSPVLHHDRMGEHEFAVSPSTCYHAYEGMEGWRLEPPGRCITAILHCHRYEGANHRTLSRLRAFTMREVVWIGAPRYVIESRAQAEELLIQWAKDWELSCTFETANDMFFTQDYAIKASFQRQQQAKKELRLMIPSDNQSISVFSSNFHAMTFGKAFDIKIGERQATSGCIAWGLERWVYAIISQFGFDPQAWPTKLREEYEDHRSRVAS